MTEPRLRRVRTIGLAVALGSAAGIGAALVHGVGGTAASSPGPRVLRAQVRWDAGEKPAPVFTLRDESGRRLSLTSFRGHPVLLTFLDSVCKGQCPLEGRALTDVERQARSTGMVLAVVGVDPWSESSTTVRRFARRLHWSGRWHWFLGSARALRPVWRAYGIGVRRMPGDVAHSVALYVIDPHGDMRAGYLFPFSPSDVVHDVQALALAGGGSS
jgi:cytochrome oxidase Cu insertion factor (SCO1/SenC/PrrC family)